MNKKLTLAYFFLVAIYCVLMWYPTLGVNDLCDASSNEVLFSQESVFKILFEMRWKDQSPLYFLILHFWYLFFDFNPFWFRFLSIIFVVLIGFVLLKTALYITNKKIASLLTSCLFIISPLATWCVFNGRMYPIFILFVGLAFYNLLKYIKERKTLDLTLFILCNIFLIYTHFFGFLITGLFFLSWLILETRLIFKASDWKAKKTLLKYHLTPFLISVSVVQTMVFPQILRLGFLISDAPTYSKQWSIPSSKIMFLNSIANFNFLNDVWPYQIQSYSSELRILLLIILISIFLRGLFLFTNEIRIITFVIVPFSVFILYLLSSTLDMRYRYFIYLAPVVFLTFGIGLFAPSDSYYKSNQNLKSSIFKAMRILAGLVLISTYIWTSNNKAHSRYSEYSRVTELIDQFDLKNIAFYTSKSYASGIPIIAAKGQNLRKDFSQIRLIDNSSKMKLFDDIKMSRDIVFFLHKGKETQPSIEWAKILNSNNYHTISLSAYGVKAEIYTKLNLSELKKSVLSFSQIEPEPSDQKLIEWAMLKTKEKNSITNTGEYQLLTSRISNDGSIISPEFVSNQHGHELEWDYLEGYWNKVKYTDMVASNIKKEVIWAHPIQNSTLLVILPHFLLDSWLQVTHTIGAPVVVKNNVTIELFIDHKKVQSFSSSNKGRWLSEEIDTDHWKNTKKNIILLIRCEEQRFAHFGFNIKTFSSKPKPVSNNPLFPIKQQQ